ncbi:hypothetical protein [Massilia sp. ST3]|jgi:hypothetical protein|uniref:hypothetical protein n=1 Tax=Massilia sp. ST3 TaxID=2824903 RepID=UPI001B81B936|nr:hypothetical protein [Massilia sp. ST3]MBQ5946408.1 hypothetical protein [Massilia sp. ST3]
MTTKAVKAAPAATITTDIEPVSPAPTVLVLGQLPREVTLSGLASTVFQQSVVLARNGYIYNPDRHAEVFPSTGLAFLHMILGTPEEHAIKGATETIQQAQAEEQREFDKRVAAAAKQLLEDQAAAAKKAEAAAAIAAAEAALAALRKAAQ